MKPYDPDAKCVKCGHDDINSSYHPKTEYGCSEMGHGKPCNQMYKAHIVRSCQRCHYQWLEAPMDDKGATSKGILDV